MTLLDIAVLALVQGITEFLPVSSQGHVYLAEILLGVPDQGLVMVVALHVGTLGAVVLYFWRDLWAILAGLGRLLGGRSDPGADLAGYLLIASVPVAIAGFALNRYGAEVLRTTPVIAWATIGFGIVLYATDRLGMTVRRIEHMRLGDAIIIGLAQALALIPGTSRSGITMSAARMLGMERAEAARFSMLLSIPAILGAGGLTAVDLYLAENAALTEAAVLAAVMAFIAATIAMSALMAWLRRSSFTPCVSYRVLLGGALLGIAYGM